jgi:hypothetical protein
MLPSLQRAQVTELIILDGTISMDPRKKLPKGCCFAVLKLSMWQKCCGQTQV